MARNRFFAPLLVGGVAGLVALGATLADRHVATDTPAQAAPGGIIDPHTGKRLTFDPNLQHIQSPKLQANDRVKLNALVPNFSFADFSGKTHQLRDYKGKIAVVTFVFAECPCTRAYNDRMSALQAKYEKQGVALIYVFAHPKESLQTVRDFSKRQKYTWTQTRDDKQPMTKLFDAHAATESYVIDRAGVLRYHGRIDDEIFAPESVSEPSLELALKNVLAGQKVVHPERPVFACSIPRA